MKKVSIALILSICLIFVQACGSGGGGGSSDSSPSASPPGSSPKTHTATLQGTAATGSEPSSSSAGFQTASSHNAISNGVIEVYNKNGGLLASGTTEVDGSFTINVPEGNDYFIKVTSSDLKIVVKFYIPSVTNPGIDGLFLNAYSSTIVYTMENMLNVDFASPGTNYDDSDDLLAIYSQIVSDTKLLDLVTIVGNNIISGIIDGISDAVTAAMDSFQDTLSVKLARLDLTFETIKNSNTAENNILTSLTLPTNGTDGTAIVWNSTDANVISTAGTVNRPIFGNGDATLTLTASISKNDASDTKNFVLTVIEQPLTDLEAVAAAKTNLTFETIKNSNSAENNILTSLTLPTGGTDGTTISWNSTDDVVISTTGDVTRPTSGTGNTTVTLTAEITKRNASTTKTFTLTVIELTKSDLESVKSAWTNLTFDTIKNNNFSKNYISRSLTLPTSGTDGTTIVWSSTHAGIISTPSGTVNRPVFSSGNITITLTASISKSGPFPSTTKNFVLTVIKQPRTDLEAIAAAKTNLTFEKIKTTDNTTENNILSSLILPTSGTDGTTIAWSSTDANVISTAGTVNRPVFGSGDATVTLTASISKNDASDTKNFVLTVIEQPRTDLEAVAAAKTNLTFETIKNSNSAENNILTSLTLPTGGTDGTTIVWTSTDNGIISTAGTVNRPSFGNGDATVTLTASISKNNVSDAKSFILAVINQPQTDAEAVAAAKTNLTFNTIKNRNSAENNILTSLTLPSSGTDGTAIVWSSTDDGIISTAGTVNRPIFGVSDRDIHLSGSTVHLSGNSAHISGHSVHLSGNTVHLSGNIVHLSGNTVHLSGNTVHLSGNAVHLSGNTFIEGGDAVITLTAAIGKGSISDTKDFILTVIKLPPTDNEAVSSALSNLTFETIKNNNSTAGTILTSLFLPTSGANGTAIRWSSTDPDVISTAGTVNQPLYIDGNKTVTLTAAIDKGNASDTKVFVLTVVKDNIIVGDGCASIKTQNPLAGSGVYSLQSGTRIYCDMSGTGEQLGLVTSKDDISKDNCYAGNRDEYSENLKQWCRVEYDTAVFNPAVISFLPICHGLENTLLGNNVTQADAFCEYQGYGYSRYKNYNTTSAPPLGTSFIDCIYNDQRDPNNFGNDNWKISTYTSYVYEKITCTTDIYVWKNLDIIVNIGDGLILITNENGLTDTFTISLANQPVGNVTLDITSTDPSEVMVSSVNNQTPSETVSIEFTAADWSIPQTITVTGQDDQITDSSKTVPIGIVHWAAHSILTPEEVEVVNSNND